MKRIVSMFVVVALACFVGTTLAEVPAVSTFAPAKNLEGQVPCYIKQLEKSVASCEDYEDLKTNLARDASTLSVIALSLGLHDTDNQYKKASPALIKACQETAAAKDYAAAKAGVEAIKKALSDQTGDPSKLKWEKVAGLKELMEVVPLINTKLKRYTKGKRLLKKVDATTGYTAVIAAIAQASIANAKETEKPTEVEAWEKFCSQMRDAATKTNQAITTADADKVKAAMTELQQSCDDCHKVFHEAALENQE